MISVPVELGLSRMLTPPLATTRADLPGASPATGVDVAVGTVVGAVVGATAAVGVLGGRVAVAAARLLCGDGDTAGVTRIWKPPQATVDSSSTVNGNRIGQYLGLACIKKIPLLRIDDRELRIGFLQ